MGRPDAIFGAHRDHEPRAAQRRAGVPPAPRARSASGMTQVCAWLRRRGRRDACPTLRFMGRGAVDTWIPLGGHSADCLITNGTLGWTKTRTAIRMLLSIGVI